MKSSSNPRRNRAGLLLIAPTELKESYGSGRGSKEESMGGDLADFIVDGYRRKIKAGYEIEPPLICRYPDGSWIICDGHHRVRAAVLERVAKLACMDFDIDE